MPVIIHQIIISAPIEKCFNLARDVDVHTKTVSETREKAVAGVTTGLLKAGDLVTWEAVHFGIKQRLTAEITEMKMPHSFTDIMIEGVFDSFVHKHQFLKKTERTTLMIDTFHFKSPFGLIGKLADHLVLERYMKNFIAKRAIALKKLAEEEEWK